MSVEEKLHKRIRIMKERLGHVEYLLSHQRKHMLLMEQVIKRMAKFYKQASDSLREQAYTINEFERVKTCKEEGCTKEPSSWLMWDKYM